MKEYINGLSHIGVPVKNLTESAAFYESLGFARVGSDTDWEGNEKVAFMAYKGVTYELYVNHGACGAPGAINHIALAVDDINGAFLAAKKAGYTFTTPGIVSNPDFIGRGNSYFMIAGPDGDLVEFCKMW